MMYLQPIPGNTAQPSAQRRMTVADDNGACDCPACRRQRLMDWLMIIAYILMIIFLLRKLNS